MNIASLLLRGGAKAGNAPAVGLGTTVNQRYPELHRQVCCLSGGLTARGIRPGDRIILFMANRTEYLELLFAIWWCGAVAVPVNSKLRHAELAVIVDRVSPALVFGCPATAGQLETVDYVDVETEAYTELKLAGPSVTNPAVVSGSDLAWLFFTSGTTGVPKGAMITHRNLFSMVQGYLSDVDNICVGAALIHCAPMSHGSGLYALPFIAQGGISVIPESGKFQVDELVELVKRWPESSLFAAPTMVRRLTRHFHREGERLRNLRTIVYGGGPLMMTDLKDAARVFGPVFAQIYGQGECPMSITAQSRAEFSRALAVDDDDYLGTVGRPFIGTEVKVIDGEGATLEPGETGEIVVRSDTVFKGYWQDPEATREAIVDGWLITGDRGHLDQSGALTLAGRSKETIISGGSNVYPIEVEKILVQHPAVIEVAVVGLVDEEWGEIVAAFVATGREYEGLERELNSLCRQQIAAFKCPKVYYFRSALPKNAYGKISKIALINSTSHEK